MGRSTRVRKTAVVRGTPAYLDGAVATQRGVSDVPPGKAETDDQDSGGSFDDGSSGALTDQSVGETVAEYYAEAVRRGAALVTIWADESRVDEAERILRNQGAFDIEDRVVQWKSEGWTRYNPNAEPYSVDEIERNRARYRTSQSPLGR